MFPIETNLINKDNFLFLVLCIPTYFLPSLFEDISFYSGDEDGSR